MGTVIIIDCYFFISNHNNVHEYFGGLSCCIRHDTHKAWHDVDKYQETAIDNANTLFFRFYMFIFKSMHNGCMCTVIKYVMQDGRGT